MFEKYNMLETTTLVAASTATLALNGALIWATSRKALTLAFVVLLVVCVYRLYQISTFDPEFSLLSLMLMLPISALLVFGFSTLNAERSMGRRLWESLLILCIIAPAIYWMTLSGSTAKQQLTTTIGEGFLVVTTFIVAYLPGKHTKKIIPLLLALIFLLPVVLFLIVQDDLSNDAMGVVMVLGSMFVPAVYYLLLFVLSLLIQKTGQEIHKVILALCAFVSVSFIGNPLNAFIMWLPKEMLY